MVCLWYKHRLLYSSPGIPGLSRVTIVPPFSWVESSTCTFTPHSLFCDPDSLSMSPIPSNNIRRFLVSHFTPPTLHSLPCSLNKSTLVKKTLHAACVSHAKIILKHEHCNVHVAIPLYMHASCSTQ